MVNNSRIGLNSINLSLAQPGPDATGTSPRHLGRAQDEYLLKHSRASATRAGARVGLPLSSHPVAGGKVLKPSAAKDLKDARRKAPDSRSHVPDLSVSSVSLALSSEPQTQLSATLQDTDFESLREEDDRLLAELERYSTPDLLEVSNASGSV